MIAATAKMNPSFLIAFLITTALSVVANAAVRSSADYSIPGESIDSGGGQSQSANYFVTDASVGQFGTGSDAELTSTNYASKPGFIGQTYYVIALAITAPPSSSVNEAATRQLTATPLADDGTTLTPLDPSTVTWSILNGPITSISSSGLATAGVVFQDTPATVLGSAQNFSSQLNLTVLNVNNDDFGAYANDTIADSWQVQFFGLPPNAAAGPNADPDGDGSTNAQEFQAGTNPLFPDVRLLNISTRLQVLKGDNVLIGGFIVGGTQPKTVAVRAIAPSLTPFGVQGALDNPILELHRSSDNSLVSMNDNWKDAPNAADIMTRGLAPGDERESVILDTLPPGGYTAIVRGVSEATGVALVEAYDLDQTVAAKLGNISTRGFVGINDNVMIGGFIVNGTGTGSPRVVVRALGPTLTSFGVPGAIDDPTLELLDANGATLASNDNWQDSQAAEIFATGLQPPDTREPAIVRDVAPGRYTAIVRGSGGATGVSLVEVYNVVR